MRSNFFSSIAHELRTPLNSIIPIIRLILDKLMTSARDPSQDLKINTLLKVILNSSLHL